jgi:hypothetical protein
VRFDYTIRRGICHMQANAYANGKAEAELMAQIAKKTVIVKSHKIVKYIFSRFCFYIYK